MTEEPQTLLAAYKHWREVQERPPGVTPGERIVSAAVAKVSADALAWRLAHVAHVANVSAVERRAHKRGVKRMTLASRGGANPTQALAHGFRHYRKKGGSKSLEAWRRQVAGGR